MNVSEARRAARERGFSHARSYDGPVLLGEWRPYGEAGDYCDFSWISTNQMRDGDPATCLGACVGVWTFLTEEQV